MNVLQVCGVGILALSAMMVLKASGYSHPEVVLLIVGLTVMGRIIINLREVVTFTVGIAEGTGAAEHIKLLLKAAGLAFLTDFTSGICRDAGEGGVAEYVELFGKTELVVLMLPVVGELIDLSFGMLNV